LALGSWLWYRAIPKVSGVTAAAFMGVMPLSALLLSYVLLGEPVRSIHIIGFATVFVGVALMSWEHARMSKSQ
jgi:drug/metabolite transporter (DMT)-like permease